MNITVNSDRTVEKEYTEKDGSQNENRITELNFILPTQYSDFVQKIVFITEDGNFSDYIENNTYILKNNITKYREVSCYVWLTDSVNNKDFRSQTFPLEFYYNEDPSDYIPSEQEKSQIELLFEELDEKIQEVTELEENVYTKDETYTKQEVKNLNNLVNYTLKSSTGSSVALSINNTTYVMTLQLKDINGNTISTGTVDLPLETMVVNASYDSITKEIVLTLQSGSTVRFSVADLVSGLVSETTFNQAVSSLQSSINAKYTKPNTGIPKSDLSEEVKASLNKADTALQEHQDISGKEDKSNKTDTIDENSTEDKYPNAEVVYNELVKRDENINDLQEQVNISNNNISKIEDILYKKEKIDSESNSLELENTVEDYELNVFKVNGNSTQRSTIGKNLIKNIFDQYLKISGTGQNRTVVSSNYKTGQIVKVKPNTNYTISGDFINFIVDSNARICAFDEYPQVNSISTKFMYGTSPFTFTTDNNTQYILVFASEQGQDLVFENLQLEEGSTATDYEEYTGGQTSPNPNYKQDINNVEGDVEVKAESRNLFDYITDFKGIISLTNYITNNNDGTFTTTGTGGLVTAITKTLQAGTYTISLQACEGYSLGTMYIRNTNGVNGTPNYTFTLTEETEMTFDIRAYTDIVKFYIQLEPGTTATPYVPHAENSVTFPLAQGQKLMLGDTLEDDGIHHKRGQYVFTGNELITKNAPNEEGTLFYCEPTSIINTINRNEFNTSLCNYLTRKLINQINTNDEEGFCFNIFGNRCILYFNIKTEENTVTAVKSKLAEWYNNNTPMIIEYPLLESAETIDPYTLEQQIAYLKMQNLKQYNDTTYVSLNQNTTFSIKVERKEIEVIEEIEKLQAENEQLWNDHKDITDTGTDLTLQGTGDLKMEVDVGGNSTQESTRGINELPYANDYTETKNGITLTQSKGKFVVNGTAINAVAIILTLKETYTIKSGDYLHLLNTNSNSITASFSLLEENTNILETQFLSSNRIVDLNSIVGRTVNKILFYASNGTVTNFKFSPMILNNISTLTDFDEYTGNQASPNPTYKQNTHNVTGNTVVKAHNKNLFNENTVVFINGMLDDNGQQTVAASHYTNNFYMVEESTDYTLSGTITSGTSSTRIYFYDENKNWISRTPASTNSPRTFATPAKCKYIRLQVIAGLDLKTGDVQLEKGSTATPYVPYKENSVTFPLAEGQKLMLGDYLADDGVHHKRKQVDKTYLYNHINSVTEITDYVRVQFSIASGGFISISTANGLCSHFKFEANFSGQSNHFYAQSTSIYIIIAKTLLNSYDVAGIQTFLNNHPDIIVEYELATETIEPYTSEQQEAYNKLKEMQSYYDLTYVEGTSADAKPIITAHAKKSLKVMQSEIDELKQAILNS